MKGNCHKRSATAGERHQSRPVVYEVKPPRASVNDLKGCLTVSIVTYHTPLEELDNCLRKLISPVVARVLVVDNGNEERIRLFCIQKHANVTYVANENTGYGAAHNKAVRIAAAEGKPYHLVMNSDLDFDPGVLDELAGVMESNPEVGLLHPMLVNPDGSRQFSVRMLPTPFDLILRRFLPSGWFRRRRAVYLLASLPPDCCYDLPYHQGSFMLFRRHVFGSTGMFDTRFFMYPEDIDITRRIHREYVTLYYTPAKVIHLHRHASYKSMRMLRIHMLNMCRYFNKWGWWRDKERRQINRELRAFLESCRNETSAPGGGREINHW